MGMNKAPTSRADDCSIQKYIGSAFDDVKIVADNIDDVKQAATVAADISSIVPELGNIKLCADNMPAIIDAPTHAATATAAVSTVTAAETVVLQAKTDTIAAKDAAKTSETNAQASEINTHGMMQQANTAKDAAKISETNAATSKDLAEKWASNPEDVEVTTGKYSAFHWAEKALYNANLTFISGGLFTPQAGSEYPNVSGISRDTIWIVNLSSRSAQYTFTTGDLAGKTVISGDQLFYDTPSNSWASVHSGVAGAIISVNGQLGPAVNLTASDVGARPDTWVPNASEINGLDTELGTKIDKVGGATGAAKIPAGDEGSKPDISSETQALLRYTNGKGWEGSNPETKEWGSIGGGIQVKPITPAAGDYPYTVSKGQNVNVDISDDVSKAVTIPAGLVYGDAVKINVVGWTGMAGVTVTINPDSSYPWNLPTGMATDGEPLVLRGNESVTLQIDANGKLVISAKVQNPNAVTP